MRTYWPRFDLSEFENSVPAIEYLDWYIPRLIQERKHNLSFSGMQYDWDVPDLLKDGISVSYTHLTLPTTPYV